MAIGIVAVLLFAGLQPLMPAGFVSVRGLNPLAVAAWRAWLPGRFPASWPLSTYVPLFRGLLVLTWAAYAGAAWLVYRGARFSAAWTWPLAVPVAGALAVAMPASLSTDVFAYVGYARMAVVHGLDPYLHTQTELVRLGDPTAGYLHWPIASPYGPLWTWISIAIVWLSPARSVLWPVIVFKLLAACALGGLAACARSIVRRSDGARANAIFVLVAMNPLLLLEGPGNGHNDLLMALLVVAGLVAIARGRWWLAALSVGAAAAVKMIPLLIVPWLAISAIRSRGLRAGSRWVAALVIVALALAPVVIAYAPFWSGMRTLNGLAERWKSGVPSQAAEHPPVPAARTASAHRGELAASSGLYAAWKSARRLLGTAWPALVVYLWAMLAMAIGKGDAALRLATVWSCVALAVALFVAGLWFPWYLAWIWPVVLLRFTRVHLALGVFLLPFSVLLMLAYAMAPS